jgi:hypothetical protein
MARSWEYSRGRHIAMQITMWLILAVMLGLAALVAQERQRSVRVALSDPVPVGLLLVRVPAGWRPMQDRDGAKTVLVAAEPGNVRGGGIVEITQELFQGPPPAPLDYLAANAGQDIHPQTAYFDGLQQLGFVAAISPEDQEQAPFAPGPQPAFLACAVVPLPTGQSLAVMTSFEPARHSTIAGRDVFQQLANAITLAPPQTSPQRQ